MIGIGSVPAYVSMAERTIDSAVFPVGAHDRGDMGAASTRMMEEMQELYPDVPSMRTFRH
jgi:hypothetical protein